MSKPNRDILNLFIAYTVQEISEEEFLTLQLWLDESVKNKKQFEEYLLFYKKARRVGLVDNIYKENAWNTIVSQLQKPLIIKKEKLIRRLYWKYTAVASIFLVIALTIFLSEQNDSSKFTAPIIVNNNIKPGINKAILTLEDGSDVSLKKDEFYQAQNIISDGEGIVYKSISKSTNTSIYNYLTIPKGGQFQLQLSDKTKVWLNSDSKLKYPVNFRSGEPREVELIYGEAYFDVSSSKGNGGTEFRVSHQLQEIEVLGTEFNVKAYKNETNIYTTLVEGKVSVKNVNIKELLTPNQQLNFNTTNNLTSVAVVDVYREVSWKDGVFNFKNKSLQDIMIVLSRWYDMDVTFADEKLKNIGFDGVIGKDQNIEEILTIIKNFGIIKNYEINDKNVILK